MVYQQDEKFLACIFDAMHTTLSSWQETRSCFYISKEHHKSSLTLQPHTIKTLNMKTNMPAYLPTLLLISLTIILGIDTATAEADKDDHLLHLRGTASSNKYWTAWATWFWWYQRLIHGFFENVQTRGLALWFSRYLLPGSLLSKNRKHLSPYLKLNVPLWLRLSRLSILQRYVCKLEPKPKDTPLSKLVYYSYLTVF